MKLTFDKPNSIQAPHYEEVIGSRINDSVEAGFLPASTYQRNHF
jgi:hypothetical protein